MEGVRNLQAEQYRNLQAERQRKFEEGKLQQANAERSEMLASVLSLRTVGALW